jgi:hypothetical protein
MVTVPSDNQVMTNKGAYMTEFETKCYGMSEADINAQYMQSMTAKFCGLEMVVMGVLSDCQEMLSFIDAPKDMRHSVDERTKEQVRKQLNIAKFILSEMSGIEKHVISKETV